MESATPGSNSDVAVRLTAARAAAAGVPAGMSKTTRTCAEASVFRASGPTMGVSPASSVPSPLTSSTIRIGQPSMDVAVRMKASGQFPTLVTMWGKRMLVPEIARLERGGSTSTPATWPIQTMASADILLPVVPLERV